MNLSIENYQPDNKLFRDLFIGVLCVIAGLGYIFTRLINSLPFSAADVIPVALFGIAAFYFLYRVAKPAPRKTAVSK